MLPVMAARMNKYATAFASQGFPAEMHIVMMLDAKKQQTCKPSIHQYSQYSVHKKGHGPKYQTLQAPDGLIFHCSSANDGRCSDPGILRDSGLVEFWYAHVVLSSYRILADSAYPTNDCIIALYKNPPNGQMPVLHLIFNPFLSPERTGIEWGYKEVVTTWAFLNFRKNLSL